jgi:outer membrane protein OmpA-like peptidoglycan-associated protein
MPQEQSHAATAVVAGIVTIVVALAALAGAYWVAYPQIAREIDTRFAALDAKVAGLTKAEDQADVAKLGSDVAAIKQSLQSLRSAAAMKTAAAAPSGAALDRALASLKGLDGMSQTIDGLKTQLAALKTTVGTMKGPDTPDNGKALDAVKDAVTGIKNDVSSLNDKIAAMQAEMAGIKNAVADMQPTGSSGTAAAATAGRDLAIVSVTRDVEAPAASIPPMSVYFDRIGSADDKGQTAAIVRRLQTLLKGRTGCTIAVAGHTDTLGPDNYNLGLSRQRADEVAAKLKTALAGQNVVISESARGERALETWTPDNTPRKTNRRVEINVTCKS